MTSSDFRDLPGILAEIAEIAGREAAELVAQSKGGCRVYMPPSAGLRSDHWLAAVIGPEKALMIAKALGDPIGYRVDIPLGPTCEGARAARTRASTVRSLTLEGASATAIARRLGITDRAVRMIRERLRRTGDLPPEVQRPSNLGQRATGKRLAMPTKVPSRKLNKWL